MFIGFLFLLLCLLLLWIFLSLALGTFVYILWWYECILYWTINEISPSEEKICCWIRKSLGLVQECMVGGWDVEGYAIFTYNTQISSFKPRITNTHTHVLARTKKHSALNGTTISLLLLWDQSARKGWKRQSQRESTSAGRQCLWHSSILYIWMWVHEQDVHKNEPAPAPGQMGSLVE